LKILQIPAAEHEAGGGNNQYGDEGNANESKFGFVQTRYSGLIFAHILTKSNKNRTVWLITALLR
jgi:hypothetical protein